jgi:hypothetical protein
MHRELQTPSCFNAMITRCLDQWVSYMALFQAKRARARPSYSDSLTQSLAGRVEGTVSVQASEPERTRKKFGVRRCLPLWLHQFCTTSLTDRHWMLTRRVICPLLSQ